MPGKHAPPEIRFWRHVKITGSCWTWTGSTNEKGYGTFKQESGCSPVRAHRYSWELAHGEPPPTGVLVLHSCDNPPCVRPEHLFLGSDLDNSDDKISKGRWIPDNPEHVAEFIELVRRLSDSQIVEAYERVAGGEAQRSVAADLGVNQSTISRLVNGHHWQRISK